MLVARNGQGSMKECSDLKDKLHKSALPGNRFTSLSSKFGYSQDCPSRFEARDLEISKDGNSMLWLVHVDTTTGAT